MAKYTKEYKMKIVEAVIKNNATEHEMAKKYGVNKSDVHKWVSAYRIHGMAALEKKKARYTGEFKQKVVEDMREEKLSYRETAAKYNLGNHNIVAEWERIYLEEGSEGLYVERRGRTSNSKRNGAPKLKKEVEEDLIAEVQRLKMEVEYLKKLNALIHQKEVSAKKTNHK